MKTAAQCTIENGRLSRQLVLNDLVDGERNDRPYLWRGWIHAETRTNFRCNWADNCSAQPSNRCGTYFVKRNDNKVLKITDFRPLRQSLSTVTRFITYPQTPPFLQTLIPFSGLHSGPYWQYFPEKSGRQEHWNWLPMVEWIQTTFKRIDSIKNKVSFDFATHSTAKTCSSCSHTFCNKTWLVRVHTCSICERKRTDISTV